LFVDPAKQEFIELFRQSGWSQAEAARQLHSERGTINGIVTGRANPSAPLLELLRLKMATSGKPLILKEDSPGYGVDRKLSQLPDEERKEVLEIFNAAFELAVKRVSYDSKKPPRKKAPPTTGTARG
jgi:transcriptional regulator with XRE-family HTH domain